MRRRPPNLAAVLLVLAALTVAGCGGSSTPSRPVAERICGGAAKAAQDHGAATVRILSRDASNVVCAIRAGRVRVHVVSQAVPQAYTEFDTESSHQSQVYGGSGASGVHQANRTPLQVMVPGAVAAIWVPAQTELVATSGTPTQQGGAYVVVDVDHVTGAAAARSLAIAVTHAVFAARPTA